MGHINSQSLRILRDAGENGINYCDNVSPCDVCAFGKSKQQRHPKTIAHTTDRPFQLVYADLLGSVSPPAFGGFRYVSKFTDQHSKWKEVFLIKEKGDAVSSLQQFVQTVVIPRGLRIERLRKDRGREYTAGYFEKYCLDTGIRHEFAASTLLNKTGCQNETGEQLPTLHAVYWKMRDSRNLFGDKCFSRQRTWPTACRTPSPNHKPFSRYCSAYLPSWITSARSELGPSYTSKHTRRSSRTRPGKVDSVGTALTAKRAGFTATRRDA